MGITKANYYWKLHKVREALLKSADSAPAFVELKELVPEVSPVETQTITHSKTVAVIKTNYYSIEISDQVTSAFLNNLPGAAAVSISLYPCSYANAISLFRTTLSVICHVPIPIIGISNSFLNLTYSIY